METRPFGPTGVEVPVIGQGTWSMERTPEASLRALRRGLDLGMTHVDTAEMYADGAVEELVGRAISGRRDELFLVSKVLPGNASRRGTVEACERSLRRLGTDRLDCYLLHWQGRHPIGETVDAFRELREAGKIDSWGVSNFDVGALEGLLEVAEPEEVACNQLLYHLEERTVEHRVIPFCAERGIVVVAYSPLGSGSFPGPDTDGGRVLTEVAEAHGATPQQVALAFLVRRAELFAIPKASDVEHVEDNAAAGGLELSDDEIGRIDDAFPLGRDTGGVPTL